MGEIEFCIAATITLIVISVAAFLLGVAIERRLGRRSETVIMWRDENGSPFKRLTYYGEHERSPFTANYSPTFYSDPFLSGSTLEERVKDAMELTEIERGE